jgi:hypothetical protein
MRHQVSRSIKGMLISRSDNAVQVRNWIVLLCS